jgi:excisionase family DNA binding protein
MTDYEGPRLLTLDAAALVLGCSLKTVRRRIADGSLQAVRDHDRTKVRSDDLQAYIDNLARAGGSGQPRRRARRTPRTYVSLVD